jgi:hypothetical protein
VAHAHDLKVEEVAFGDMRWQAARSGKGWQKQKQSAHASGARPSPDDVRITVAR